MRAGTTSEHSFPSLGSCLKCNSPNHSESQQNLENPSDDGSLHLRVVNSVLKPVVSVVQHVLVTVCHVCFLFHFFSVGF